MRKRWILVLILIVIAGYYYYENFGMKFAAGYSEMEASFNAQGASLDGLGAIDIDKQEMLIDEVNDFKKALGIELFSGDAEALKSYLDVQLELLEAGNKILEVKQVVSRLKYRPPACGEAGEVQFVKELVGEAKNHLDAASEKARVFGTNYSSYALSIGFDAVSFRSSMVNQKENFDSFASGFDVFCE